ncbi:MAG: branched-chain amino acid ABC transporter permease [Pseudomonadota bacterium]
MSRPVINVLLFAVVAALIVIEAWKFDLNAALFLVNMGLLSALMALGVNLQWGYAGLFNIGVMGFVALGGLAAVLVGMQPVPEAWAAGGGRMIVALILGAGTIVAALFAWQRMAPGRTRNWVVAAIVVFGWLAYRFFFDPARDAIEAVNPAGTGFLGGLGLEGFAVTLAWPVGGLFAAGAAWIIGKTALGLRSDYLAIATLGIAEIIISILKNEDWLSRGVKNVVGVPRPVAYEVDLQASQSFLDRAAARGYTDPVVASTLYVKVSYTVLFAVVLAIVVLLAQLALNSPWGRMMRAIRDNETAAEAMGKDVTRRRLQVFILGSAICGLAGAMLTTLEGQFVPGQYQPLRFTFLIWVMVIIGGSGNNWGSILGGFLIFTLWTQGDWAADDIAAWLNNTLGETNWFAREFNEAQSYLRLVFMGVALLAILRFAPRGLIPER